MNTKSKKTSFQTNAKSGLKVKAGIQAGGIGSANHNRSLSSRGLKVRSGIQAGGIGSANHNRRLPA
jgi:hypothetical protein